MLPALVAAGLYFAIPSLGNYDHGRVIELSHGTATVIYKFCARLRGQCWYGDDPIDVLPLPDGSLFGATAKGGAQDRGVLFQLIPSPGGSWTYKQLWYFCENWNCDDGGNPRGGLKLANNGDVIGLNTYGGFWGHGVMWRFSWKYMSPGVCWNIGHGRNHC